MRVEFLQTGSRGNCSIITDEKGNRIVVDCGLKFDNIITRLGGVQKTNVLITHFHKDHALCAEDFKRFLVPIYCKDDAENTSSVLLKHGRNFAIDDVWVVTPVFAPHGDTTSTVYLIRNIAEKKTILWATDCQSIPVKIPGEELDLAALECNWDSDILYTIDNPSNLHSGYKNHMELRDLCDFLEKKSIVAKKIAIIHTSNSGLINEAKAQKEISKYANDVRVCKKNVVIDF